MTPTEIADQFYHHICNSGAQTAGLPDAIENVIAPKTFTFCLNKQSAAGTMRLVIILFSDDNIHIEDFTTLTGFKKVTQTTLGRLHDDLAKQPFVLSLSQQLCFRHMLTKHCGGNVKKASPHYHH